VTGVRGVAAHLAGDLLGEGYHDEHLDANLPEDPLSRLRAHLRRLRETLGFLEQESGSG
jgi:hypothetical protein